MQVVNVLILIVVFVLGAFSLGHEDVRDPQPASFLPPDTILFYDQRNGFEAIRQFSNSRLGRVVAGIDFPAIMTDAGVDAVAVQLMQRSLSQLESLHEDTLITTLLGKRFSLALFGLRNWSSTTDGMSDYVRRHMLLISKPKEGRKAYETLLATRFSGKAQTAVPYGQHVIHRLGLSVKIELAMAYVDGVLLTAFEERVLREALDIHDRKQETLRKTTKFQRYYRELDGADSFFYCAIAAMQATAAEVAKRCTSLQERKILERISTVVGLESVAYGGRREQKLWKNRLILTLQRQNLDRHVQEMVTTAPSINDSLPYASRDSLLYYWSNSLDLPLLWDMYLEKSGEDSEQVIALDQGAQRLFSMPIDSLITMIGNDISLLVHENVSEPFVPIPDFAILIKLSDPDGALKAIKRALARLGIKFQRGSYRKIEYSTWGVNAKDTLQPVYTIHRDYLIIANTFNILKKILDTPLNNSRLVAARPFRELDPGFQTLNNSVCYLDQSKLLRHLQEFVGWAGTMLAIQDQEIAEKSKIIIDRLIDPLFWGLAMYEKTAVRTYVRNDSVYIEAQTRLSN